jgi:hypothetical protein
VQALAFSTDEGRLVVGAGTDMVITLDADTGARLARVRATGGDPTALAMRTRLIAGAKESAIATAENEPLAIVDGSGARVRTLDRSRGYDRPALVGGHVIAWRWGESVGVWDAATGARVAVFGAGDLTDAALSRDGKTIAVGWWWVDELVSMSLEVYRVDDGARLAAITKPCHGQLAFSPDGSRLAIACDRELWIHAIPSGDLVSRATVPELEGDLAWSPGGEWIAYGGDGAVHRVDVETGRVAELGAAHDGAVDYLVVAADGRLVTGDRWDPGVEEWSPSGALVGRIDAASGVQAVALTAEGLALVRTGELPFEPIVEVRDAMGSRMGTFDKRPYTQLPTYGRAVLPLADGRFLVLANESVRRFEMRAHGVIEVYRASVGSSATVAAVSPDGTLGLFHTEDDLLTIVDLSGERVRGSMKVPTCIGPDELAVGDDGEAIALDEDRRLYRVDTGGNRVVGSVQLPGPVTSVVRTTGGDALVLGEDVVYAWTRAGELRALAVPDATSLAVAPAGTHVFVGLADGTVLRYPWPAALAHATTIPTSELPACVERAPVDDPPPPGYGLGGGRRERTPPPRGKLDNTDAHEGPSGTD